MYRHLLVPIGDGAGSGEAVSQAVRFARDQKASVTFLHVREDYAQDSDGALLHALSPELFADRAGGYAETILAKAGVVARSMAVPWTGLVRTGAKIHEAIIAAANERACDLIFMHAERRPGLLNGLWPSLAQRVIAGTALPVMLASAEEAAQRPNMSRAVAIIRDEHRSLAAVIEAMKQLLDDEEVVDWRLLKAMIYYIREFPERLHHPKEDTYLFAKIQARAPQSAPIIAELSAQHVQSGAMLADLEKAVDDAAAGGDGLSTVKLAFESFARLTWEHMGTEEGLILAMAREALSEDDWGEIGDVFGSNGDPRFDAELSQEFRDILDRLLRRQADGLAQPPLDLTEDIRRNQRLPDAALDQLFHAARSHNGWQARPVEDGLLSELYATLVMGPTSVNCCPARFVFLRNAEQKARLAPALKGHNQAKAMAAPVVALVAYDRHFYERLPELFPAYDAAAPYRADRVLADQVALRNGSLQGAYLILAARALGLDCGPMSGFDADAVNQCFFPDGCRVVNFICCLGYGDPAQLRPRGPRPSFDEACVLL